MFLVTVATTGKASAATWLVDDDGKECRYADFATIQEAVDAADPGDTVRVCPGTYAEEVDVDKTLTLLGAQAGEDARHRDLDLDEESVVVAGAPFRVTADRVTIDGFYIRELILDEQEEEPGIATSGDRSGYRILNNVFEPEGIGLFPRSSGLEVTLVRRNLFLGNVGIATGEIDGFGRTVRTVIVENTFDEAAVSFFGADDELVLFAYNELSGRGINMSSVSRFTIRRNEFADLLTPAIQLANADGVRIDDNLLEGGTTSGIAVGHATAEVKVRDNRIANHSTGIALEGLDPSIPSTGTYVSGNEVEDSIVGILLSSAMQNLVRDNNVEDNRFGIQVTGNSAGNRIRENEVRGSEVVDCSDQTSGNGTSGTANLWTDNEGSTSDPRGLCFD